MKYVFKNNRMISQDIAKGIAILLVIIVHSIKVSKPIGSAIGVLFGYIMPFFFFMSGYNYNDKNLSVKTNLKKRLKQLLIPFILVSISVFIIMGSYFLIRNEATIGELFKSFFIFLISKWSLPYLGWDFNQVLFQRLLGPCWFIQFLIVANIIFIPTYKFAKKNNKNLVISIIVLSLISFILISLKIVLPWGIQDAPAIAASMLIANYLKKDNKLFRKNNPKWIIINSIICIITIALIQLNFNGAGYFGAGELGSSLGGLEVFIYYLIALFGTYVIVNFSRLLEKTKHVKKFLCWLGQHSFIILLTHMSIVHLLKDLFGLPQWNAADGLFGNSTNLFGEIVVAILTVLIVSYLSSGLTTIISKLFSKKQKNTLNNLNNI